jgi:sulfur carrier protein
MISITLNNEQKTIPENKNINQLVNLLKLQTKYTAILVNNSFIPKSQYESTMVNENDKISQITPMQGG